jgi:hypothetical protein
VEERISLVIVLAIFVGGCSTSHAQTGNEHYVQLVERLKRLPVEGPSIGPVTAFEDNDATRAVVAEGPKIVPSLTAALDKGPWNQCVWVVFCLRELHAKSAKPRIVKFNRELEDPKRFQAEPHDLTLDVEVATYLKEVEKW